MHVHPVSQPPEMTPVRLRARDDEPGGAELSAQQPAGVELLGVDVARVARERERHAGYAGRVPRDRRRAVGEVGVQVPNVTGLEEPVGERDAEKELPQEDLARKRPPTRRARSASTSAAPPARRSPPGRRRTTRRRDGRNAGRFRTSQRARDPREARRRREIDRSGADSAAMSCAAPRSCCSIGFNTKRRNGSPACSSR